MISGPKLLHRNKDLHGNIRVLDAVVVTKFVHVFAAISEGNLCGCRVQETSQSVTLRSDDGAGFGFDIYGDESGGIAVQSLQSGGPAQQSGLIQPG